MVKDVRENWVNGVLIAFICVILAQAVAIVFPVVMTIAKVFFATAVILTALGIAAMYCPKIKN